MTDEEKLAEKIICIKCSDDVNRSYTHCSACTRCDDFIKGLAEGKPKWHEIQSKVTPKREISKEYMPKPEEKVFLKYHFYNDTEIHYSDGYYDNYDFEFHIPNNPTGRVICVIAWCELSEFEE